MHIIFFSFRSSCSSHFFFNNYLHYSISFLHHFHRISYFSRLPPPCLSALALRSLGCKELDNGRLAHCKLHTIFLRLAFIFFRQSFCVFFNCKEMRLDKQWKGVEWKEEMRKLSIFNCVCACDMRVKISVDVEKNSSPPGFCVAILMAQRAHILLFNTFWLLFLF